VYHATKREDAKKREEEKKKEALAKRKAPQSYDRYQEVQEDRFWKERLKGNGRSRPMQVIDV
jgi:hypothetical protein